MVYFFRSKREGRRAQPEKAAVHQGERKHGSQDQEAGGCTEIPAERPEVLQEAQGGYGRAGARAEGRGDGQAGVRGTHGGGGAEPGPGPAARRKPGTPVTHVNINLFFFFFLLDTLISGNDLCARLKRITV